jgi:hypothetical protein
VAGAAVSLSLAAASARPAYGVRIGVDGALGGDTGPLADAVAAAVAEAGRPVARVRRGDFLRPRSVRLELGPGDLEASWERWYDDGALRREVLDPLTAEAVAVGAAGPAGGARAAGASAMSWLPALRDPERDRSVRAARVAAAPGTVLVVDGPYLLRWELADAFDLVVHLVASPAALARRHGLESGGAGEASSAGAPGVQGLAASWDRYLEETAPGERASYVVRFEDPRHPALARP